MAVTLNPLPHGYVRTSAPQTNDPQAMKLWLDAEFKKIERCISVINSSLKAIAAVA